MSVEEFPLGTEKSALSSARPLCISPRCISSISKPRTYPAAPRPPLPTCRNTKHQLPPLRKRRGDNEDHQVTWEGVGGGKKKKRGDDPLLPRRGGRCRREPAEAPRPPAGAQCRAAGGYPESGAGRYPAAAPPPLTFCQTPASGRRPSSPEGNPA